MQRLGFILQLGIEVILPGTNQWMSYPQAADCRSAIRIKGAGSAAELVTQCRICGADPGPLTVEQRVVCRPEIIHAFAGGGHVGAQCVTGMEGIDNIDIAAQARAADIAVTVVIQRQISQRRRNVPRLDIDVGRTGGRSRLEHRIHAHAWHVRQQQQSIVEFVIDN